jgi:mannose-1-phosphate guanylyltransferase
MTWTGKHMTFNHECTRWGSFHSVAQYERDEHKVKVKNLLIDYGKNVSYQKHEHRAEIWNILSGKGTMIVEGFTFEVNQGDVINIPRGAWHTAKADDEVRLEVLEIQYGDKTEEDDIIRSHYEWSDIVASVRRITND